MWGIVSWTKWMDCHILTLYQKRTSQTWYHTHPVKTMLSMMLWNAYKRSMDLGALLDTCNWCDKWQFSADLFHSDIRHTPLQDTRLRNLSDLEFDLLRSLNVMCDNVIGLPIYAFLLIFNSNIWPNSAPLQDIRLYKIYSLWVTLNLTFQGHSRSNVMMSLDLSYMVSYWCVP